MNKTYLSACSTALFGSETPRPNRQSEVVNDMASVRIWKGNFSLRYKTTRVSVFSTRIARQKGGDLTQSYDKSPYTHGNVKRAVTTQTTPQKSSIKQRLRTDLGRSVGVTTATQLVTNYVDNAHGNSVVTMRDSHICLVNKNISNGGLRNVRHPSASKW